MRDLTNNPTEVDPMRDLTNNPTEVDPTTGAPVDYWPTERVAQVLGEVDVRPATVEESQVAEWLRAKLTVESVRDGDRWQHRPVLRWPAQSPPAPPLPRRVPPLRRRADDRPLPSAPVVEPDVKHDPVMPARWSCGLIPTESTGEEQS